MKKPFTFLSICIALFLLTSCTQTTGLQYNSIKETTVSAKEKLPETFRFYDMHIVSAGDSLTQGVGDSTNRGGYIPYLKDMLESEKGIGKATFENYGVRGNKTDQLLKKLQTDKVKKSIAKSDLVILTIGGNDIMKVVRENLSDLKLQDFKKQMKLYETNLHRILTLIRKENPDAMIVLVGVYNPFTKWFSNIDEMNDVVTEWNATGENILTLFDNTYFVKIDDLFLSAKMNLLYKDYFHPNDKGYELIAEKIYGKMEKDALPAFLAKVSGD
ncbi:SGNH/GDSL hydrolase family protein [Niallia sp. NCCP-28]|uniref:SGNH/GDSL hydrolase family protein n=1 Tax=Niallia sp. NCCP-28 TaxID=2934712 RepID=UPI00208324D3|nr:SGNH/GDSL hydrolase family protein [Niallia sp. NCCP-28]GKU80882.1 hypothetical protein NCCP28_02780 [Niallia sp. NCCP-28]